MPYCTQLEAEALMRAAIRRRDDPDALSKILDEASLQSVVDNALAQKGEPPSAPEPGTFVDLSALCRRAVAEYRAPAAQQIHDQQVIAAGWSAMREGLRLQHEALAERPIFARSGAVQITGGTAHRVDVWIQRGATHFSVAAPFVGETILGLRSKIPVQIMTMRSFCPPKFFMVDEISNNGMLFGAGSFDLNAFHDREPIDMGIVRLDRGPSIVVRNCRAQWQDLRLEFFAEEWVPSSLF